ncbi:MAG: HAD family phosphatase [Polyangia bacterium]|jgi:putative hydrolase of the HAD superfamily
MTQIQAVFLDLGNVLAFHDDPVLFRRMSVWGGAAPDQIRQRMLELWDPINRGSLAGDDLRRAVCLAAGSPQAMAAEPFFAMWNCHFRVHHEVLPMVESLLGQVKVVLLSNTNASHWCFVRSLIPCFARFHAFIISCEVKLAKPDHAIFELALARAGVAAENAAFFDDIEPFVVAARALGIHGYRFTTAASFRAQLAELGITV